MKKLLKQMTAILLAILIFGEPIQGVTKRKISYAWVPIVQTVCTDVNVAVFFTIWAKNDLYIAMGVDQSKVEKTYDPGKKSKNQYSQYRYDPSSCSQNTDNIAYPYFWAAIGFKTVKDGNGKKKCDIRIFRANNFLTDCTKSIDEYNNVFPYSFLEMVDPPKKFGSDQFGVQFKRKSEFNNYDIFSQFYKIDIEFDDIDDDLIEMFLAQGMHSHDYDKEIKFFNFFTFTRLYNGYDNNKFKPKNFLEKISKEGKKGFYFEPSDPFFSEFRYQTYTNNPGFGNSYFVHFYFPKADLMDETHETILEIKVRKSGPGMKNFEYDLKVTYNKGTDKFIIQLERKTMGFDSSPKLEVQIGPKSGKEWLHIAVVFGKGYLYFEPDGKVRMRFSEILSVYYADQRIVQTTSFYRTELFYEYYGQHSPQDVNTIKAYFSVSLTVTPQNQNLFGVRIFDMEKIYGSYYAEDISSHENYNRLPKKKGIFNRCLIELFIQNTCSVFAFMKNDEEVPDYHIYKIYYRTKGPNCLEKCQVCIDRDNCLIPKAGYNDDLSRYRNPDSEHPIYPKSIFSKPESIPYGYRQFENEDGLTFWLSPPVECKKLYFLKKI